jgi:hypothetical protein
MMTDAERRAEFKEKLKSIHFGIVPGGYRDTNSPTAYDHELVEQQLTDADGEPIFSKQRVEDKRSDFRKHMAEFQADADA